MLHFSIKGFWEGVWFEEITIGADRHGHMLITLTGRAYVIEEFDKVELWAVWVARIGQDSDIIN